MGGLPPRVPVPGVRPGGGGGGRGRRRPPPPPPARARLFDELHLGVDVDPAALREVLRGPVVRGVRALLLAGDGSPPGADVVRAVAAADLPRLERLWFGADDGTLAALGDPPRMPRLSALELGGPVTAAGAEALLAGPLGRRLRWVLLAGTGVGREDAARLAARFPQAGFGGLL